MAEPHTGSAMARETAEIPAAAERLLARTDMFAAIASRLERARPRIVVFCGRGSSGHVGVYLRYLFEARLGLLASAAAPSVVTAYQRPPDFRDALFVVVSQSGRSPDLIEATQVARKFGALTLAIVNDENSPAAAASELVLPIGAGTEHAVAATKTVVLSMIAGARLVATMARDDDLNDGLRASAAPIVRRARVRLVGLGRQCGGRHGSVCRGTWIWPRLRPRDRAQGRRNLAGSCSRLQRSRAAARPARIDHAGNARAGIATERPGRCRCRRPRQ